MSAPAPGRQTGSFGDELTNAAILGLMEFSRSRSCCAGPGL